MTAEMASATKKAEQILRVGSRVVWVFIEKVTQAIVLKRFASMLGQLKDGLNAIGLWLKGNGEYEKGQIPIR